MEGGFCLVIGATEENETLKRLTMRVLAWPRVRAGSCRAVTEAWVSIKSSLNTLKCGQNRPSSPGVKEEIIFILKNNVKVFLVAPCGASNLPRCCPLSWTLFKRKPMTSEEFYRWTQWPSVYLTFLLGNSIFISVPHTWASASARPSVRTAHEQVTAVSEGRLGSLLRREEADESESSCLPGFCSDWAPGSPFNVQKRG